MYDILYIGNDEESFLNLRNRFPTVKRVPVTTTISDAFSEAKKKSFTKMFWVVWDDLDIHPDFRFEYKVPSWDESYVHVFKNGKNYDGVCLFSKTSNVSSKELEYRFFANKKEIDIAASVPKPYQRFSISNYDDYLNAVNTSTSNMFYAVFDDIVIDDFNFDYYVPKHDQHIVHVFKNGKFYDGVCLFPGRAAVSKREFEYRFFSSKKEVDIEVSHPALFDIVFISYFEKFADENFNKLVQHVNGKQTVHRIDGVKGIHQAHKCAAELVTSDMFWVVDADAEVLPDFNFDYQVIKHDRDIVHVWRSRNPINDLEYGYGGVKLLPTRLTLNMNMSKPDMTTSISSKFKAVPDVSNITAFNTDAFSAWRSAFRECVKLSSNIIDRNQYQENAERLNAWLTYHPGKPFAQEAVEGAYDGREYGRKNAADPAALALINDFDWLKSRFEQTPPTSERFQ